MTGRSEVITTFLNRPPPEKHSAAFKIFNYRFICQLAQMHLYTMEYLQQNGYATTGNPVEDRELAKSKVHAQLTIAAMAVYHNQGVSFHLVNPSDAAKIYRILLRHLQDWNSTVNQQFNMVKPPIEDLRMFEDLASTIHPYAAKDLAASEQHTGLSDRLDAIRRARAGATRQVEVAIAPTRKHQHTPMVDAIARTISERAQSWR